MKAQFDQNILSSFYLWFENRLLGDSCKAYKTNLSNAFTSGSFPDVPSSHIAFQGKYRSLVGEHKVDQPNSGFFLGSNFITGNYDIGTATGTDAQAVAHLCNAGTAITVTLPTGGSSGVGLGRFYIVKDITGNAAVNNITVQVNGTSSDTIDDASTSVVINSNFQAVYFLYGATNKWVRI